MKNILVINGNPVEGSYGEALTNAYLDGVKDSGNSVKTIQIKDMNFDPNLKFGYTKRVELEPDVANAIELIQEADHIVWVFPIWWQGPPALLKGFIDRTFLPGIAFKRGTGFPQKLFKGKTARVILTNDTPRWYSSLFLRNPAINQFKKGILWFSGIRPVKITYINPIKNASPAFLNKWINRVHLLGAKGA